MAKLENFTASMEMASGLKPSGENDFPLVQANDIVVDEEGTRLDADLAAIKLKATTDGNTITNHTQDIASVKSRLTTLENKEDEVGNIEIIVLSGSSGTIDSTSFAALVANPQGYALQKAVDSENYVMTYCGDGSVSYLYAMSYMTADEKLNSILCTVAKDSGAFSVVQQLGVDLTGSLELDTTLSVSGKAADAKAVGDAIANLSGGSGVVIIALGSNTSYTLSAEQLAALNESPESFTFSISDSKLSGRTVILRHHAKSTQTNAYVSVYAYENTIYAYQCLVTIGGGVCTVSQNSYPIEGGSSGGGSYVLELSAESGTLTDEQYNAVVANAPTVVVSWSGFAIPLLSYSDGYYAFAINLFEGEVGVIIFVSVNADKSYSTLQASFDFATKTYVDNAVANAGGGGIIDVTELPTENIDEKSIYRLTKSSGASIWAVMDGQCMDYGLFMKSQFEADGGTVHLNVEVVNVIDGATMKEMVTSNEDGSSNLNFYILDDATSENDGYVYIMDNPEVGPVLMSGGQLTDHGWVDVAPTASSANGIYAVRGGDVTTYHAYKDGWTELVQKEYVDNAVSNAKTLKTATFGSYDEAIAFIATNEIVPWRFQNDGNFEITGVTGGYSATRNVFDVELLDRATITTMMLHSIKADYQITLSVIYDNGTVTTTVKAFAKGYVADTGELTAVTSGMSVKLYYF